MFFLSCYVSYEFIVILVTAKQEVERKSEWFCGVKFFFSNFEAELENAVLNKISLYR